MDRSFLKFILGVFNDAMLEHKHISEDVYDNIREQINKIEME